MTTGGNEDFYKEIREIMYDRITAVSEKLHQNGMRWSDMFSEEDNRAIETYKIETVGESEQEAAEREMQRRDTEKRKIEAAMKLRASLAKSKAESMQRVSITEKKTCWKRTECDESEQVPDDPNPPPILARKWFGRGKNMGHDVEPSSSRMGPFHRRINCSRGYRKNDSADIGCQIHCYWRNYVWRDTRMNRTSENSIWNRPNGENNTQSGFRRPYHFWRDQGNRRFHNRPRWYSNACSQEQYNQEHAHSSSSGEIVNSHHRYENNRPPWRKLQCSTRSSHH